MSNKVFQAKVANVPGGIEMLLAAGYALVDKGTEATAAADTAPIDLSAVSVSLSAVEGAAVPSDVYLVHGMDAVGEQRLAYTIAR